MEDTKGIPEYIPSATDQAAGPVVSRTKSDDLTVRMRSIDHRCTRQNGPPDFSDEADTLVDAPERTLSYGRR